LLIKYTLSNKLVKLILFRLLFNKEHFTFLKCYKFTNLDDERISLFLPLNEVENEEEKEQYEYRRIRTELEADSTLSSEQRLIRYLTHLMNRQKSTYQVNQEELK
jgi:hypothetical protein